MEDGGVGSSSNSYSLMGYGENVCGSGSGSGSGVSSSMMMKPFMTCASSSSSHHFSSNNQNPNTNNNNNNSSSLMMILNKDNYINNNNNNNNNNQLCYFMENNNTTTNTTTDHHDSDSVSAMRAKIMSHPHYSRLLAAYINCQKIGAPPEAVLKLEEAYASGEAMSRGAPKSSLGEDPPLDQFMEAYCEMLTKYEQELTKPFKEAMVFMSRIELQLKALTVSSSDTGGDMILSIHVLYILFFFVNAIFCHKPISTLLVSSPALHANKTK
ncbi:hypothetical protein AQUCO_03200057v1 [Aquilegia coerulea]|uniref:KNOX2 domain-containing protein n=1 Tax=Aquilegia coerulea TaxID=218851 RepID=A0A2G5CZY1_AQUCA|nr:hypothetical protein AQUCO_03200057v1 [Aquilegia coerulea]